VDPQPVLASRCTGHAGRDRVHERDLATLDQRTHEFVGHRERQRETGEPPAPLGFEKALDVGMIDTQHAHLRAAARAGRLDLRAGGLQGVQASHHTPRRRVGRVRRAPRADRREVIAHTAAFA
jgi:hypothetical protein